MKRQEKMNLLCNGTNPCKEATIGKMLDMVKKNKSKLTYCCQY